jgi:glycerol-3-phosphate O-acyltransferase
MEEMTAAGAHLYLPRNDEDYAIEVGLRMLVLRRLVDVRDGVYTPAADELHMLRYYANSIAHLRDPSPPVPGRHGAAVAAPVVSGSVGAEMPEEGSTRSPTGP